MHNQTSQLQVHDLCPVIITYQRKIHHYVYTNATSCVTVTIDHDQWWLRVGARGGLEGPEPPHFSAGTRWGLSPPTFGPLAPF